ncbi:MAG: MerR family transcriptional regulator [Gammaproteobacteria bacterium]
MNQYPIRTLSELTGIPTTTLRAWERRYGLLKPDRTPKGHRLYSSEDVELIREISALLKSNHTISGAIRIVRDPDRNSLIQQPPGEDHWLGFQQELLKSIEAFNDQKLDKVYNDALSIYPIDMVNEHVIIPVLRSLGEQWQNREAGIAEEHFFSAFLRNKLGARFHHQSNNSRGKQILVACLSGEYHELGILLYCIAAIGRGYRILYLGSNMPPQQIATVVSRTHVSAVLLSASSIDDWDGENELELKNCIDALDIPVMFGGDICDRFADRIEQLGGQSLGSDHVSALDKMESIIPAYSKP